MPFLQRAQLYFRGQRIFEVAMEELKSLGMRYANQVIVFFIIEAKCKYLGICKELIVFFHRLFFLVVRLAVWHRFCTVMSSENCSRGIQESSA